MSLSSSTPYSAPRMVWKYVKYRLKAGNKHSVHPPTLFNFAEQVLDKANRIKYRSAESERRRLKSSEQVLDFVDFGKSGVLLRKSVSDIAKRSLKSPKYAKLLCKIVAYHGAKHVLELGTSLGITTAYLARNKETTVTTLEGDPSVVKIAESVWNQLGHTNITSIVGPFEKTLDKVITEQYDIIYIDGNHRLDPTLRYFDQLLQASHSKTLFIFDDIHYSEEMEKAWKLLQADERVTSTIDLFFIGIVYIDPSLSKQNFTLKF